MRKRIYGYGAEAIPALIQVGKYINTGKTRVRRVKSVRQMGSFERAGLRGRRGEPRCRIVKRAYGRTLRYHERARLCCEVGGVCAEAGR